jgi:hypothetical protein
MTDETFVLSLLGVIGGFAVLFTLMWAVWQWIQPRRGLETKAVLALREELRALREGQEAMAVELERVSEGQRFVTRVLAEREEAQRLGRGEGR